ncbi:MAG: GNAT family N-acetyltransferase [Dehalococcoidia bacterium]|nr:GNAT family N-acetyltransferase [Dehalococcoidia bacterium]
MNLNYSIESLDWLEGYWRENRDEISWEPLFVIPPWLKVWQRNFSPVSEARIFVTKQHESVTGIAPLLIKNDTAALIGSPDVCDYVDFIVTPGQETEFFHSLFDYLKNAGVSALEPGTFRLDSPRMSRLTALALEQGYDTECQMDEFSLEKDLPGTWDEYLQSLDAKQRHEVRRKLRRLEEAGKISYKYVTDKTAVPGFLEIFLKMFVASRNAKAIFLTDQMERYFRDLALTMVEEGLLRGGILELDSAPVASVFAFDYNGTVYLYNSGFDPAKSQLSVGILSKALLIKDSIERGRKKFSFLKGEERYKYHLGGKEVPLQKCRIVMRERVLS